MNRTRRDFLKTTLGASTLLAVGTAPAFLARPGRAANGSRPGRDSILVVLQLSGGNDGLNTVVPYEDEAYHRSRPTLRLTPDRVLKLDSGLGLHPDMPAFLRLYREGQLSIVQGVGYAANDRDHERAMQDWHTAQPKVTLAQTGWIGRVIDQVWSAGQADLPGVFLGPISAPFSLRTEQAVVPALKSLDQWLPARTSEDFSRSVASGPPARPPVLANPLADFLERAVLVAASSQQRLEAARRATTAAGAADYPRFPLAQTLKSVAQLIRAELGIRIFFAELGGGGIGGFDTHAGQAANQGVLLRELSESVAAFVTDLRRDKLLDSVLLMTFSEFGRTLAENGRRGTDHGNAAPVFLAGGGLKGGLVGAHPSLSDLDAGAPRFHTDFRRVYATILDRWLGFDSQAILGGKFTSVEGVIA